MAEDEVEIVHSNDDWGKHNPPKYFDQVNAIEKVQNISYDEFFHRFMLKYVPVTFTGIADGWECMNWTSLNTSNKREVNYEYLAKHVDAELKVPIANCNKTYFNSHEKTELLFGTFLDYWQSKHQTGQRKICKSDDLLYLKDWHLRRDLPNYSFYKTPIYFASDWLNEYCIEMNCDDYRFVYMGPKGTWTPFHVDVFSSFSWSTNIAGTKKWFFFPPGEEEKLRDSLGNIPFDLETERHQQLIHAKNVRYFEVIQNAGETVFVPSGWHHQVWNLDDTISVNHNWFNACNIYDIWLAMHRSYKDILHEIDDCKDMTDFDDHCQVMLKSVFGLDFQMFLDVLSCIAKNRRKILFDDCSKLQLNEYKLGRNHAVFDLQAILLVTKDFQQKCALEKFNEISDSILVQIDRDLSLL